MFGLGDDILPQGGQPTFVLIARHKAFIFGSMMLRLKNKHINLDYVKKASECVSKSIMQDSCRVYLML